MIGLTFSLGIKVPKIIEEVKTSLNAGFCVVIGLQTTGEVRNKLFNLLRFFEPQCYTMLG